MMEDTKENIKTKVVTMRINSGLYARVQAMARAQKRKIAPQIEILVERGLHLTKQYTEWPRKAPVWPKDETENETVQK
jgi:hypothetical protein